MRVEICPPCTWALTLVVRCAPPALVVPWQGHVLATLSTKDTNMFAMILTFVLVFGRLAWRPPNLPYKFVLHGLRNLGKGCNKW
jgi:hypothetical protein